MQYKFENGKNQHLQTQPTRLNIDADSCRKKNIKFHYDFIIKFISFQRKKRTRTPTLIRRKYNFELVQ